MEGKHLTRRTFPQHFVMRLLKLMAKKGLDRGHLTDRLMVIKHQGRSSVSAWLTRVFKGDAYPDIATVFALADALNVDYRQLLPGRREYLDTGQDPG